MGKLLFSRKVWLAWSYGWTINGLAVQGKAEKGYEVEELLYKWLQRKEKREVNEEERRGWMAESQTRAGPESSQRGPLIRDFLPRAAHPQRPIRSHTASCQPDPCCCECCPCSTWICLILKSFLINFLCLGWRVTQSYQGVGICALLFTPISEPSH